MSGEYGIVAAASLSGKPAILAQLWHDAAVAAGHTPTGDLPNVRPALHSVFGFPVLIVVGPVE
jgi:hypothetical protein